MNAYFINGKIRRIPSLNALDTQIDNVHLNVRTFVGDDGTCGSTDIARAYAAYVADFVKIRLEIIVTCAAVTSSMSIMSFRT